MNSARGESDSPDPSNRRRSFRVHSPLVAPNNGSRPVDPYRLPVQVELVTERLALTGTLLDLSIHGLAVILRKPLDPLPRGEIFVQFELPEIEERLYLPVVARYGQLAPGGFRLGLEIRISDPLVANQVEQTLGRFLSARQQHDRRNRAG